jgi:hypothetical protein
MRLPELRVRVTIHPDGETTLEYLRDEDVGVIRCAHPCVPALGELSNQIRLMDDRLMIDAFTGQPIDVAAYEALNQFVIRWTEASFPPNFEWMLDY